MTLGQCSKARNEKSNVQFFCAQEMLSIIQGKKKCSLQVKLGDGHAAFTTKL